MAHRSFPRSLRTRLGVAAVAAATASALVVPVASAAPAAEAGDATTTTDTGTPDTGLPVQQPAGSLEDGRFVGSLVTTDWAALAWVAAAVSAGAPTLSTVIDVLSLIVNSPLTSDDIAGSVAGSTAGSSSIGSSSTPAGDDGTTGDDADVPAENGAPAAE